MEDLKKISDDMLLAEVERRKLRNNKDSFSGTCPTCRKWPVYDGCSSSWRSEAHCFGCRQPIANCRCSRV